MGDFLIKIHAVGGHGCNRDAKAGETFVGCGRIDCPDCVAATFVKQFAMCPGVSVQSAVEVHWPVELNNLGRSYDEAHEVTDDLFYVPNNLIPRYNDGKGGTYAGAPNLQYLDPKQRKRIKGSFKP